METISIKSVEYVVIERRFTQRYKVGEVVAIVSARRKRGVKFYVFEEVLTASGYQYRKARVAR